MNHSENNYFFIGMYPSTTLSWRDDDQLDYEFVENNLHIGKFKNSGAYILLDVSFETVLDEDHSQNIFREMLAFCAKHELTPGLFVNHETIKYNEHEYKSNRYNITDVIDQYCIDANVWKFLLVDAGMNLELNKNYQTKFEKYVANIWINTSFSDKLMVTDWVKHERFSKEHVGKSHLLSDLSYVKYPIMCFMSRSKFTRLTFYTEAKKQGWWDSNPYMTFKDFNQEGEVESPVNQIVANSSQYINDQEAQEILLSFKDRPQHTAPGEFYYDSLTNWPCGIGGVGFPPSTKSIQENFIAVAAESETTDTNFFITEKTIQPMFNLMPVTILGQPGINTFMEQELGFDMFKDIVDYTEFDYIDNDIDRGIAFAKTIHESIIVNFEDVLKYWKERQSEFNERLYNNYDKMFEFKNQMIISKILNPEKVVETPVLEETNFKIWLKDRSL